MVSPVASSCIATNRTLESDSDSIGGSILTVLVFVEFVEGSRYSIFKYDRSKSISFAVEGVGVSLL